MKPLMYDNILALYRCWVQGVGSCGRTKGWFRRLVVTGLEEGKYRTYKSKLCNLSFYQGPT
jgi:hypothetical protein